jgi:hypothetical protein
VVVGTALFVVFALLSNPAPALGLRAPKNSFTGERSSAMSIKNGEITPDPSLIEDSPQQAAGNALAFAVQKSFGPR